MTIMDCSENHEKKKQNFDEEILFKKTLIDNNYTVIEVNNFFKNLEL